MVKQIATVFQAKGYGSVLQQFDVEIYCMVPYHTMVPVSLFASVLEVV
jgi:hypothetical protein